MSPEPAGTPPITTDSVAAVVTNDLVVRTKPGTEVDSEILRRYLNAPQLLYVIGGPVTANGYEWYLVAPLFPDYLPHGEDPPSGWVAAGGKDGEAWIATSQLHCPRPNLHRIMELSELARLACFGDRELTLQGTSSGCFVADPVTVEPQWLSSSGCNLKPDGYDPQSVPAPGPLDALGWLGSLIGTMEREGGSPSRAVSTIRWRPAADLRPETNSPSRPLRNPSCCNAEPSSSSRASNRGDASLLAPGLRSPSALPYLCKTCYRLATAG